MRSPVTRLVEPLRWQLNRHGISTASDAQLEQIVLAQRERAKTIKEMAINSLFFFRAPLAYDEKAVRKHITPDIGPVLVELTQSLALLEDWSATRIHAVINDLATGKGLSLGKLAQPIRLALCGGTVSPPIDATLAILGKNETLLRLGSALATWGV
jgi:glutamyl-tRNA synthetase